MKNEFIPYEQALALKELGFDESCYNQYTDGTLDLPCTKYDYPDCVESIPAPLYQQAFRWFREKYNLEVEYSLRVVIDEPDYYLRKLIEIVKDGNKHR